MTEQRYTVAQIIDEWKAVDLATLLFVVEHSRVLLIRKKRGLGAGKINGPGGKREVGESALACAIREVQEELCITPENPVSRGRLRFQFTDDYSIDVEVFVATEFTGTPTETDEAIPLWFPVTDIPFDEMWADDQIWLPHVLAGNSVDGRFVFASDTMLEHDVEFS